MFESPYLKKHSFPKRFRTKRIFEIDFIRGFDILLVVIIHSCFLLSSYGVLSVFVPKPVFWVQEMNNFSTTVFFGIVNASGFNSLALAQNPEEASNINLLFLEIFFAGLFVFISGISCSLTKNNAKRGLMLAYVAEIMTVLLIVASNLFKNDFSIIMGILHAIAIALLLYVAFDHFFPSLLATFLAGIFLSLLTAITLIFYVSTPNGPLYDPLLKVGDIFTAKMPEEWWKVLIGTARYGEDYFSPVQVSAILFLGAAFGKQFYRKKTSLLGNFNPRWAKPILFLGRHTLAIYVLHQPVVILLISLLYLAMGFKLNL